ncbi:MAG: histidinol dehydrogenase [Acidimicrobiales bacterium]
MPLSPVDVRGLRIDQLEDVLPRPAAGPGGFGENSDDHLVADRVTRIIEKVRLGGDNALLQLTKELDRVELPSLTATADEIRQAREKAPGSLIGSLELAWQRLIAYHRHQAGPEPGEFADGIVNITELVRPVGRAGLYTPGGLALYPSSVLMCAAPATVAGVSELALCVPPGRDGKVPAIVLAAASIAGIAEVHPVGGAQAIAAMAFGTQSVARTDVIAGPGNRYVAEAKRQVAGTVGVAAAFAGPSEVVVIADGSAPAEWAAIDLLVQAEHGPDGLAFLVTWDADLASRISQLVDDMSDAPGVPPERFSTIKTGGYSILVDSPTQAIDVANMIAPEHLELQVRGADQLAKSVRSAGVVFVGPWAPASVGDYVAGTNHILPTARTAHFSSALRVDDFRTHIGVVELDREGLAALAPHVSEIAESEGLQAHADSVRFRSEGKGDQAETTASLATGARTKRLPTVRADLARMKGYHSAQVDVTVRLNTNESPFPPPAGWLEDLGAELRQISFNRYPDRQATRLREAVAAHEGVDASRVFCANGSNEVLQTLLLAYGGPGRTVAVFEPTYALHSHIAKLTATAVYTGWRGPDHRLERDTVDQAFAGAAPVVTFLCSPNNPTGMTEPDELLAYVLENAPGLVVVDEAYGQFSANSALELVASGAAGAEKLIVTRTFSKTWSMAACRLGYMVADAEIIEACQAVALPYHLDAMSQAAGVLALRYEDEMRNRIATVVSERERVQQELSSLAVEAWPSEANFVLFRPIGRDADLVWRSLLDDKVLIRDCSGWPGLTGCLRVTIGTPEENTAFIESLKNCLADEGSTT